MMRILMIVALIMCNSHAFAAAEQSSKLQKTETMPSARPCTPIDGLAGLFLAIYAQGKDVADIVQRGAPLEIKSRCYTLSTKKPRAATRKSKKSTLKMLRTRPEPQMAYAIGKLPYSHEAATRWKENHWAENDQMTQSAYEDVKAFNRPVRFYDAGLLSRSVH